MRCTHLFTCMGLLLSKLVQSSSAFLVIPSQYHGKWLVSDSPVGTFHVTSLHVSARFRSAELRLKPKSIYDHEIFLHDMDVVSHPSALDIRSVWKNIGYFYAVRKHGISLQVRRPATPSGQVDDDNVLDVQWYINSKYSGSVRLTRADD